MQQTPIRRHLVRLAAGLVLIAGSALAGPPGAAQARPLEVGRTALVSQTVVESAVSSLDSSTTKTVSVTCSNPTHFAYAPAATIDFGAGRVSLVRVDLNQFGSPRTATATATETGVFANSWRLTVRVVCGLSTVGMKRTLGTPSAFDSTVAKSAPVSCLNGERLYGIGGFITGGTNASGQLQVLFTGFVPTAGLTAGVVTARELNNAFAGNWSVSAVALCAGAFLSGTRPTDSVASTAASSGINVLCPFGRTHGIGSAVSGAAAAAGHAFVSSLHPFTTSGFTASAKTVADAASRTTTTYLICNQ